MATAPSQKKVARAEALDSLSALSQLAPGIADQLAMPESLFELGPCSFSSDPALPASVVSGCFRARLGLPQRLPDYAIDVSQFGSSLFCTFIDKSRKVIAGVRIGRTGEVDWDALTLAIREALRLSARLRASKRRFSYVMAGDDGAEPV